MKKILLISLTLLAALSCREFDDTEIWEELGKHEDRILRLETLCNQMNTNITSLQTIIIALQNNDYVVNIAPIKEGNKEIGYTITFSKSGSITIYHGEDGANGKNGADGKDGQNGKDGVDGKDGQDGYTPKIGVRQHTDGKYYWTLDGNWLLDDSGNMIPTTGKDGQDGSDGNDGQNGANGKDGITPQFKIEDGYWYMSYDNGISWQKLGKATGNNGLDGEDGESLIQSISQNDEYVYFHLSDGTLISLPKRNNDVIIFEDLSVKAICCKYWDSNRDGELSYSEASIVTDLGNAFTGSAIIAFNELKFFSHLTAINKSAFENCSSLWKITLPEQIDIIDQTAFSRCSNLTMINIPNKVSIINEGAFSYCKSLKSIEFPESLIMIGGSAFCGCSELSEIHIPNSVASIGAWTFDDCSSLNYIYVGTGISEVGDYAFSVQGWNNYTKKIEGELVFNSTIPDAESSSYGRYDNILQFTPFTKITIGGNAIKIGSYALCCGAPDANGNSLVETLVIGESVKSIGEKAGYNNSLRQVYCKALTPPSGTSNMFNKTWLLNIYVPVGTLDKYKEASGWENFADIIEEFDFSNDII